MPPRIRILQIIKSLGRGGAEMLLPETLDHHNRERFEFHYLYFLPWKNQMVDAIEKAGGRVICFPAKNNFSLLLKAGKVAGYCRENAIDLIHAHLPWAGVVARIAGKYAKVPVVYTEHNNFRKYAFPTRLASWLTYGMQRKVLTVSEEGKRVVDELRLHRDVEYVANGVNTEKFLCHQRSKNVNRLTVGTVAVFRRQKRLDRFLDVATRCQQQGLPFHFLLVGDGPERQDLESRASASGLSNCEFVGLQEDPKAFMERMDVFLITSDFEGLPVALLEAMSMEVIPVSTAVGGIPSVIRNAENGFLLPSVETSEIVSSLNRIDRLSRIDRMRLAGNARSTVIDQFSIARMVTQLELIYEQLLESSAAQ